MKLKMGVLIVILSTVTIIGLMNLVLSKTTDPATPITPASKDTKETGPAKKTYSHKVETIHQEEELLNDVVAEVPTEPEHVIAEVEEAHDEEEKNFTKEDIKKINSVVALSDADLAKEAQRLKDLIEKEDLFGKLEDGSLSEDKEVEVKETLERFALLGLENARRKYMAIEPELKNPLLAYKDSLQEIRALLNDEEDFDDE